MFPENERGEILSALEAVDYVCTFDEDTPLETILEIRPDILVKGADWVDNIVGSKEVEGWGGKVVALPLVEGQSTTGIIERVLAPWKFSLSQQKNAYRSAFADFLRGGFSPHRLRNPPRRSGCCRVGRLAGSARALFIAGLWQSLRRPLIVVTPHDKNVSSLASDIEYFHRALNSSAAQVCAFPALETDPYSGLMPHAEILQTRATTLWCLRQKQADIVVTSIRAASHAV